MKKSISSSVITSLTGKFLVATPNVQEPLFKKSVIYLCEHNKDGAIGLIINYQTRYPLDFVFEQMEIEIKVPVLDKINLMIGGPLQQEHGFVMHKDTGENWRSTLKMSHDICITTSSDILKAIALGEGPKEMIFILGYSAWDAGQVEKELTTDNSWLVCSAEDNSLLFDVPVEKRWQTAMNRMGVDKHQFLIGSGHA